MTVFAAAKTISKYTNNRHKRRKREKDRGQAKRHDKNDTQCHFNVPCLVYGVHTHVVTLNPLCLPFKTCIKISLGHQDRELHSCVGVSVQCACMYSYSSLVNVQ